MQELIRNLSDVLKVKNNLYGKKLPRGIERCGAYFADIRSIKYGVEGFIACRNCPQLQTAAVTDPKLTNRQISDLMDEQLLAFACNNCLEVY